MRIIIAGSREFNNYAILKHNVIKILLEINPVNNIEVEIISGTAKGADQLGEKFAREFNYKIKRFPANWDLYGKSAGYRRNEQMALYTKEDNGVLIAFLDGKSKGTKHMIDLAYKHGLRVFIIKF
jgi:hypothetical protein